MTECTQAQGLAPQSPTGSAWVCPWETKSIPGKGVFSFQTRKAAKPQHMPIPRPWPQQHSRLVALGHEVLSHLACPRLRAQPAQGGRRAALLLARAPGLPEARARPPPDHSKGWGCVCSAVWLSSWQSCLCSRNKHAEDTSKPVQTAPDRAALSQHSVFLSLLFLSSLNPFRSPGDLCRQP